MPDIRRIAVLTSGGDAPGMNAAIRAVVRTGIHRGWEIFGIRNGYAGLAGDEMAPLNARSVGNIIQLGGTILGTARYLDFKIERGRRIALDVLEHHQIEALVVIGGNGSQAGANALSQMGYPVVGISSTIDNDLYGADITIGVDTALDVALEAIDRLKTTASSHHRAFIVEVMGRECGYLALMSGIAGGAEVTVIPEVPADPEDIAVQIRAAYARGKAHAIIVVAEGANYNAAKLMEYFDKHQERFGFEIRATTLGHVQRGGAPGAFDRLLASRLGAAATDAIERKEYGVLMGLQGKEITPTPLADVVSHEKKLDLNLLKLAQVLAE